MTFCLAVFRSGTQVMEFAEYMQSHGIGCRIVNTPPEAHVGCGTSAAFPTTYLNYARQTVAKLRLNSFSGFYSFVAAGGRKSIRRML